MKLDTKYWNILEYTVGFIRHSESKASNIITLYGIIVTVVFVNAPIIFPLMAEKLVLQIAALLSVVPGIASFYFALRCINPRLVKSEGNSVIYFGHIHAKFGSAREYLEKSQELLEENDSYHAELAQQIYINSGIAWKKFADVTMSLRLFAVNLVCILCTLFLGFII